MRTSRDPLRRNRAATDIPTKPSQDFCLIDQGPGYSGVDDQLAGVDAPGAVGAGPTTISQAPCCSRDLACPSDEEGVELDGGYAGGIPEHVALNSEDDPYREIDPRQSSCHCFYCSRRRTSLQQRRYRFRWRYRRRRHRHHSPLPTPDLFAYASDRIRVHFSTLLRLLLQKLFFVLQFVRDINKSSSLPAFRHHRHRRKWVKPIFLVYLNLFPLLSGIVAGTITTTTESIFHSAQWDPGGGGSGEEELFYQSFQQPISIRVNPLLRHPRKVPSDQKNICPVWTRSSPEDMCGKSLWFRFNALRDLSLFHDCPSPTGNVQLGELFRLDWRAIKYESDLLTHTEHLRDGTEGRDCILAAPHSRECLACFQKIGEALDRVDYAYRAFNKTLGRFDCLLATDSLTATRPFSPNGTCVDCTMWYRKWVLVQSVNIWKEKPCINWCYYTQLACPHMAPSRAVDYAGHPSFQCRDLNIPQMTTVEMETCSCFHPCDIADKSDVRFWPKDLQSTFDFFPSLEHCWARKQRCEKEREHKLKLSEHAAYPTGATHAKVVSRPPLTDEPSIQEDLNQGYGGRLAGYVDENPPGNFNELHFFYRQKDSKEEYTDSQQTNELTI